MQALGSYDGGRMLFLGLGTGLGSALIADRVVVPLELGDLPLGPRGDRSRRRPGQAGARPPRPGGLEEGRDRDGPRSPQGLRGRLRRARRRQRQAGQGPARGGPPRRQHDAFRGGFRLWEEYIAPHDPGPDYTWRIVR